ncbi:MAG: DUF2948 family protein [Geminicoccaceae bacterium]
MDQALRLRAVDADDLAVIAACLQDALIPLSEMAYMAGQGRFMAAFTRFRRECLADPTRCEGLTQCQAVLTFDDVEAVKHYGLDTRLGGVKLELLTIAVEPAADEATDVVMLFAGDAAVRLRVREIAVTLEDFGAPWPARATPEHHLAEAAGG